MARRDDRDQQVTVVFPDWKPEELVQIIESRVAGHWLTREEGDREIARIRDGAK